MKKLFLILTVFPALLMASPVDPTTALQVAENFIHTTESANSNARKMPRKLKRMVSGSMSDENQQYYIYNSEDSCGFVIVSADNCATPILGYSTEGYIDLNDLPIQLKGLLHAYHEEIQYAVDNNLQATDSVKELWNTYLNAPQKRKATAVVSKLISTKWGQSPLYNDKCPVDASLSPLGGHPTTGCVATAMAQIMKYWEHPKRGTGNKSYNSDHYGTLSANFANTEYDWANMPTKLTTSSSTKQIDAVSTLMYHCGVAVEMNYNDDGNGSSGAHTVDDLFISASAEEALKTYFGYASSLEGKKFGLFTSTSTWTTMLKNELNNKRPVLYSGSGSQSGHAFICDGYDSNNNFHFNWGWGGTADGYFSLTALTPSSRNYSDSQNAIIGIQPVEVAAKAYDLYMNTDLETTNTTSSNTFTFGKDLAFTARVENNGTGTFNGSFRVAVFSNTGQFLAWSKESYHFSLQSGKYTVSKTFTVAGGAPFIPGQYRAYMYYNEDNNSDWYPVKTDEGVFLTEYNNVAFTIQSSGDIKPVSSFNVALGSYTVGTTTRIEVDVRNTASSAFKGKIKLCLYRSDGTNAQVIDQMDFSTGFAGKTTKTLSFTNIINVNPGTYYLALIYNKTGESSWYYMGCDLTYPNPIEVAIKAPALYLDEYEPNNTQATAAKLNWNIRSETSDFDTYKVTLYDDADVDYYKLVFSKSKKYTVSISLCDIFTKCSSFYTNANAVLSYSVGGGTYTDCYANSAELTFNGPNTLYICVSQYLGNGLGFYELSGDIEETAISAVDEIKENDIPSKYIINGQLYLIRNGETYTIQGAKIAN